MVEFSPFANGIISPNYDFHQKCNASVIFNSIPNISWFSLCISLDFNKYGSVNVDLEHF